MSGVEIAALSVAAMLALIYAGLYVPVVLSVVSLAGVWMLKGDFSLSVRLLGLTVGDTLENYTFGVIPLFVLMGLLVSIADLGRDSFEIAERLFRRVKGGLGVTTVVANAIFAAITGISLASAAIFTRVAVPEMRRYGYTWRFAVGVVAGSSVLGMLIPPSILMIIYGLLTESSIGHLFIAGIIPGILLAACYSIGIVLMAQYWPAYVGGITRPEAADAPGDRLSPAAMLNKLGPIVLLIALVLGGIYGGLFTPTEAGAAGALGALVLALAKRRLTGKSFWQLLMETGALTASISFLVIGAQLYSRMLAVAGLPQELSVILTESGVGFYGFLVLYVLIVLLLGTVVDSVSIMLIVLPLVLPTLQTMGIDLIWFGIVTIIAVEVGLVTPPFGLVIFAIRATLADHDLPLSDIFIGAIPFAMMMLIVLALIVAFPWLALGLL